MSAVKTAISLEEELLERIDALAAELRLPRSRVLAIAAEELLQRRENSELLARINEAYGTETTPEDEEVRQRRRARHRRLVEGTW